MATIKDVIQAVKRGDNKQARKDLLPLLKQNPRDERVWYLMSLVVDDPAQKRDCLQRVLDINPDNTDARKQLAQLGGAPAAPKPTAPPPPSARRAPEPPPARPKPAEPPRDEPGDDTWVARGTGMLAFPWEADPQSSLPETEGDDWEATEPTPGPTASEAGDDDWGFAPRPSDTNFAWERDQAPAFETPETPAEPAFDWETTDEPDADDFDFAAAEDAPTLEPAFDWQPDEAAPAFDQILTDDEPEGGFDWGATPDSTTDDDPFAWSPEPADNASAGLDRLRYGSREFASSDDDLELQPGAEDFSALELPTEDDDPFSWQPDQPASEPAFQFGAAPTGDDDPFSWSEQPADDDPFGFSSGPSDDDPLGLGAAPSGASDDFGWQPPAGDTGSLDWGSPEPTADAPSDDPFGFAAAPAADSFAWQSDESAESFAPADDRNAFTFDEPDDWTGESLDGPDWMAGDDEPASLDSFSALREQGTNPFTVDDSFDIEAPDWMPDEDTSAAFSSSAPAFSTSSGLDSLRAAGSNIPTGDADWLEPGPGDDDLPNWDASSIPLGAPAADRDEIDLAPGELDLRAIGAATSTSVAAAEDEEEDKPKGLARFLPFLRRKKPQDDDTDEEDQQEEDEAAISQDVQSRLAMFRTGEAADADAPAPSTGDEELDRRREERAARRRRRKRSERLRQILVPALLVVIVLSCGGLAALFYFGVIPIPAPVQQVGVAAGILPSPTLDPNVPTPTPTNTPLPTETPTPTTTPTPVPTLPATIAPTAPIEPTAQPTSAVPVSLEGITAGALTGGSITFIENGNLVRLPLTPDLLTTPALGDTFVLLVQQAGLTIESVDWSPLNQQYLLSADAGNGFEIWRIDVSPTAATPEPTPTLAEGAVITPAAPAQLTPERVFEAGAFGIRTQPVWSPDGAQFAMTIEETSGFRHIWVADADGQNVRALTSGLFDNEHPSWSPDASQIVFSSDRAGSFDLYVLDVTTGDTAATPATRLTEDDEADERQPTWSPNSDWIAFVTNTQGQPQVYLINPALGAIEPVTSGRSTNEQPSWSPDGDFLVFASTRDGNRELYLTTLDASDLRRLTVTGLIAEEVPIWLP